jgi:hypothetical protein
LVALCCDPILQEREHIALVQGMLPINVNQPEDVMEPFKKRLKDLVTDILK